MKHCLLKSGDAQILKTLTTERTKLLERKGIDAVQIDNYARLIFATNADHPIQIEYGDRRFPALHVRENKAFADEKDPTKKVDKRRAYFRPIFHELENGGHEALLGFLLDRDIRNFNPEAIPETGERQQQILQSASVGDQMVIEFARDGCLPGALAERPWIARSHKDVGAYAAPGLLDAMRARGGIKLAHMSDNALSDILKEWEFKRRPLSDGKAWEAPPLPELRAKIRAKYPAVEFDERAEWAAGDPDEPTGPAGPAGLKLSMQASAGVTGPTGSSGGAVPIWTLRRAAG
jgi:hypothetical protein